MPSTTWNGFATTSLRITLRPREESPRPSLKRSGRLTRFPTEGDQVVFDGTRELVFVSLPFVAIYEVRDHVQVPRILHGAQRWPGEP
jgi:plasmid stabilization system protein ParE